MSATEHTPSLDGNVIEISVNNVDISIRINDKDHSQTQLDMLREETTILRDRLRETMVELERCHYDNMMYHTKMEELRSMMDHHMDRVSNDVGTLYIDNIHGSDKETESDERMDPIEHRLRSKCDVLKEKSMELDLNKVLSEIEQKYEMFHRTIVDDDHTSEDEECDICWTDLSCDHICNDIERDLIE